MSEAKKIGWKKLTSHLVESTCGRFRVHHLSGVKDEYHVYIFSRFRGFSSYGDSVEAFQDAVALCSRAIRDRVFDSDNGGRAK